MEVFPFLYETGHIISLVGAGGKSTVMDRLAKSCSERGMNVLVSTTTHIWKPQDGSWVCTMEQVKERWNRRQYAVVGLETADGKLAMLPMEELKTYMEQADLVFLEADGSKQMPLKVPSVHEPVLLPESDIVIAVCGMQSLGRPLKDVCFRLEEAEKLLKKNENDPVTEEDIACILTSEAGSRKLVGSRGYYVVFNQCDETTIEAAKRIALRIFLPYDILLRE
jgi:probable selenium-dependent hydroxylase accessory protein YqeC